MGEVVNKVSQATNNEAVCVTDVGQHQMMATRYFKHTRSRSMITSGGLGTMGTESCRNRANMALPNGRCVFLWAMAACK